MGKVGRNDPCPCGSGRKYKRCCAGKLSEIVARETPAPERPPARRTAFVNSVGGVGDAMAIPAFIQYYKGIHPDDQTLLDVEFDLDPEWKVDDLGVVAFIQNNDIMAIID